VVRVGDEYKLPIDEEQPDRKIVIKIVEVIPYRKLTGGRRLLIGYKLIDGNFVSPTAHLWINENEDIRPHLKRVVEFYNEVKSVFET